MIKSLKKISQEEKWYHIRDWENTEIEHVAIAIWNARPKNDTTIDHFPWDTITEVARNHYRVFAKAAIKALRELNS